MAALRLLSQPESQEKGLLGSDNLSEQAKILLRDIFEIRDFIRTLSTFVVQLDPDLTFMDTARNPDYMLSPWDLMDAIRNIHHGNRSQAITTLGENGITLKTTETLNYKETKQEAIDITPSSFRLQRSHRSNPFLGKPATLHIDSGWTEPKHNIRSTETVLDIQHLPLMKERESIYGTTATVARMFGKDETLSVEDPFGSSIESLLTNFRSNLLRAAQNLLVEVRDLAAHSIHSETTPRLDMPQAPWEAQRS